jgi:hypothetical protein
MLTPSLLNLLQEMARAKKADEPKKKGPTALRTARAHGDPCSLFPKKPTKRKLDLLNILKFIIRRNTLKMQVEGKINIPAVFQKIKIIIT